MRMKILHVLRPINLGPVTTKFHTNGLVKLIWLLDKYLTLNGHKSYLAWSKNSKIHGTLIPVVDNLEVRKEWSPLKNAPIFKYYYAKLSELVQTKSFDIIHYH